MPLKGNSKYISGNYLLSSLGAQNKDIGVTSHTLLTRAGLFKAGLR